MTDLASLAVQPEIKGRSLWADARRRFMRNKAAVVGLAILVTYFRNRGTIAVEDINLMKG